MALISGDAIRGGGDDARHYKSLVNIYATADFIHEF